MFHRQRKKSLSTKGKTLKDLTSMVTSTSFLAESKRALLLQKMREYTNLEDTRYHSLCSVLIENLVNHCQNLPESTNSYYAQAGGLVDHALNRTEAALGLFQEFIIHDPVEILTEEQKLWQYALFSAAILQGIGKLYTDYLVHLYDNTGKLIKEWNPLFESLMHAGTLYDYEFQKENDEQFRARVNLLLAKALMPISGFTWIASNSEVLCVWLALLSEDQRSAGTLGAILIRADAIAIQRYLAEFINRAEERSGGPIGRAGTFSGGVPESIEEKEQLVGVVFLQWLIKSLREGLILINKAPLMMVPGGFLMCPEIFQLFVREHPEYKNWQAAQKGFLSLGLHRRAADGNLTSRFEEVNNQKMHAGIVFSKYEVALSSVVKVHNLNTGKVETITATEFIHHAQGNNHFIQHAQRKVEPLEKLTPAGFWKKIETEMLTLSKGLISRG